MPPCAQATHAATVWSCCRSLVEATLAALTFAIISDTASMASVDFMAVVA